MSDEEKKAIERIKRQLDTTYENRKNKLWYNIEIVLNLIDKQQKEIEELKKPKYLFNANTGKITTINNSEFISEDKIKAKIEELERQEKEEPDAFLCKRVLQSLLEKE